MTATILIAEDQPNFRKGLHSIVEQQLPAYTIIGETGNGDEAWSQISSHLPEIALLDIHMPGLSGIEVAERIHSHRLDTVFVMITGYQEFHYAQSAVRYGAFDFILKPCSEDEIVSMLDKANRKVQERQSARQRISFSSPDKAGSAAMRGSNAIVDKITRFIDEHYMQDCSVAAIAANVYLNPTYISTLFKKHTGIALSAYLTKVRLEQAKALLDGTDMKVTEIAEATGFGESAYFANVFRKAVGVSPSDYRNAGTISKFAQQIR